MAEAETAELRAAIEEVQGGVGRRRYGAEVKARALAYLQERAAAGVTAWTASQEIGLPRQTLLRWSTGHEERAVAKRAAAFRKVAVSVERQRGPGGRIVVHGPRGLRIEGLTQPELVAILRALG